MTNNNFIKPLGLISTHDPIVYKRIDACQSKEELLSALRENANDLLYILEHFPQIDDSNRELLTGIVSLVPVPETSTILERVKGAIKTLRQQKLHSPLKTAFEEKYSAFLVDVRPNIHRLSSELKDEIARIASEHSLLIPLEETFEKADQLLQEIAKEHGAPPPFKCNEILLEIFEHALKRASTDLDIGNPAVRAKFNENLTNFLEGLDDNKTHPIDSSIIQQVVKTLHIYQDALSLESPLPSEPAEELSRDLSMSLRLAKNLDKKSEGCKLLENKVEELTQTMTRMFLTSYAKEQEETMNQLQTWLLLLQKESPKEWTCSKEVQEMENIVLEQMRHLTESQIQAIKSCSSYDPAQKKVVTAISLLKELLATEAPSIEEFKKCCADILETVRDSRTQLASAENTDIALHAYMLFARELIHQIPTHIQPALNKLGPVLSDLGLLNTLVSEVNDVFSSGIELEIEMIIGYDHLITLLFSKLCSETVEEIRRWTNDRQAYELGGFQAWLESAADQQDPRTDKMRCEDLYVEYLSVMD